MHCIVAFLAAVALLPLPRGEVTVAYAASLVRVMNGPIASELASRGVRLRGEPKGSIVLARFIQAKLRTPDVFITADPTLLRTLRDDRGSLVASATELGSARMVLGCLRGSAAATHFATLRSRTGFVHALQVEAARIGRTDPRLDPKGARTLRVLGSLGDPSLATSEPTYPEEDLVARVSAGALDCAWFYSTELADPRVVAVELPPGTNLDGQVRYAAAILRDAAHPAQARGFVWFLTRGAGRTILERAGVRSPSSTH